MHKQQILIDWSVDFSLTALSNSISVHIGPSPWEREKEGRNNWREKRMSKQPPTAPVPSAVGPCLNTIKIKALKASASEGRNFYKGVKKKKKKKNPQSFFNFSNSKSIGI